MKIITINLPEKYLESIQTLQDLGIYPTRSEAVRVALRNFLVDDLSFRRKLDPSHFKLMMRSREI